MSQEKVLKWGKILNKILINATWIMFIILQVTNNNLTPGKSDDSPLVLFQIISFAVWSLISLICLVFGIVVSNHGGRVLDQCPATAEVLSEIAEAVGDSMTILVDGGIRSGVDVFKALALGADGVLICRPFVTAVYGGAKEGVFELVDRVGGELQDTMTMCGAASIEEITKDMVR